MKHDNENFKTLLMECSEGKKGTFQEQMFELMELDALCRNICS